NLRRSRVLPALLWNTPLRTATGVTLPTPDGWIADAAIAIEVESREYHYRPEDWKRTLERPNELAQRRILVLQFPPAQISDDPERVLRTVEDAYLRRKATGVSVSVLAGSPFTA